MEKLLTKLEQEDIVEKGVYTAAYEMDSPGIYLVLKKKGGKYGVISSKGRLLIPCKYESISHKSDDTYECIGLANKFYYTDTYNSRFKLV